MDTERLDNLDKHKKYNWRDKVRDLYELVRYRSIVQKQRHGERFGLRTYTMWQWMVNHSYIFIGMCIVYGNMINWHERSRRDEVLNAIEQNRRNFYDKSFDNEYMTNLPNLNDKGGLYDGPRGYIQVDKVTGLKTNADGKIVAPTNAELAEKLRHAPVTGEMLAGIKDLYQATYTEEAKRAGTRQGEKRWTGWM